MTKLKGFLFALDNVAMAEGTIDDRRRANSLEFARLIKFLLDTNVRPIVFANRSWTVTVNGKKESARSYFTKVWGPRVAWYVADEAGFPRKPQAASLTHVLTSEGLSPNEVVFLGNDHDDMRVAVNGGVLFLTASWQEAPVDYGFRFESVRDVARFVDLFCLRDYLWYYEVPSIEMRSLGLVSNQDVLAGRYSKDAIATFKAKDVRHRDFWTKYLVSTLYFAGIHDRVSLIAPYPGHSVGYDNEVVRESLTTFAKCFRLTYCPDLIVRHKPATKSQTARLRGEHLDHRNQLNTIHITSKPSRYGAQPYRNSPFKSPRSILVVDDFTTEGYGLDSARAYLRSIPTIQDIFLVSLLRFPNRHFHELSPVPKIVDPFAPNTFTEPLSVKVHSFGSGVVDPRSIREIAEHFSAYDRWTWPA